MKRTSLTTAVIAGIAGVAGISNMASAVYLNSDGLGQVLIYPYYTVNGGNSTILTVVNTTAAGKAVKVRFLEAYNSREVLDFNLYLSPHDVWTAQVVPVGAGAGVFSTDNSCTVPALKRSAATATAFRTAAFDGSVAPKDGGPTGVSRTLEGYIELIEMATVVNDEHGTLDAITHTDGVPASCDQVIKAWASGYWKASAGADDTGSPTGGLYGSGTIVNVGLGTIEGYNADAVDQFYLANGIPQHTPPESLAPSLNNGTSTTSYVFAPSLVSPVPSLATTTYSRSVDAVSSLFMADAVYNEYWTGGGTAASSEWVITFPTKRFYVDKYTVPTAPLKPFDLAFSSANGGTSCADIGLFYYDREEGTPGGDVDFSPRPEFGNALCWEAQVVTFNQKKAGSAILGSNLTLNIDTSPFNNGWAQIDLYNGNTNHQLASTGSANVFRGLPVTGFWAAQLVNGAVNGVLANYTGLYRHKLHRICDRSGSACS